MTFRADLHRRASALGGTVVFAEGHDPRVQAAATQVQKSGIANIIVLDGPVVTDPKLKDVTALLQRRKPAGPADAARDPIRFAAGLVAIGEATAAVAGATVPTADVVRAALWAIGAASGVETVSSAFYMVFERAAAAGSANRGLPATLAPSAAAMAGGRVAGWQGGSGGGVGDAVLTFTDAGVVPEPTAEQLAGIAVAAADDRRRIVGDEPKVAFLSYSTKGSASGPRVDRVVQAVEIFKSLRPDVPCDGELQGDAALVPEVAQRKAPGSPVAGNANVLVFPDLDSANIAYKLVQRLAGAVAIGPILQGLAKPMADLSRGASSEDIVDVAAVALLQSAAVHRSSEEAG